jgi:hypothetical protein
MQHIDFTKMMKKYPLLDSKDVSFLNDFFNSEKVQEVLSEIDDVRKKKIKYWFIILAISVVSTLIYVFYSNKNIDFVNIFITWLGYLFLISLVWLIIWFFIFKKNKTLKWDLIPNFVKKMNENISYSQTSEYFTDSLANLKLIWMLKKYTRVDFMEDSIKYVVWDEYNKIWNSENEIIPDDKKNIEITWCEIKTSEKRTRHTKNWTQTYYVVTNHCYMMKVDFKNPKYIIKNAIKLFEDINDNYFKKASVVLWIQMAIIFIPLQFFSDDSDWWELFKIIFWYLENNLLLTITALVWMYIIIWFIYSYIRWKKRVKLENIEFEKEFDVYCDDQIESRKLLTPSFMYRLVDYVNKISRNRVYELYFHNNYFYVKYNILRSHWSWNYMNFSPWESVFTNLKDYVEFYLEIKNITALTQDLKLFYYDKWLMSNKIIK